MFTFEAEQSVHDVNGVKFGGQPGEHPTVMVGSLFYKGDSVLNDPETGEFEEEPAREAIKKVEELQDRTGNPAAIDCIGDSPEALIKHVDFCAEVTDLPIFADGPTPTIRAEAAEHIGEVGLGDQIIYNSIESSTKEVETEIEALQDSGIEAAVLLSIDTNNLTLQGRRDALEENLTVAEKAGIGKPIVDPAVIDIPDSGYAAKIIHELKDEYGLPAGCSPHNEVIRWEMNDPLCENSKQLRQAVANSVIVHLGADFNLYGPIHGAEEMYEVMSTADAYVAYGAQMGEGRRPSKDHPIYKIFR
ncbi:tetrahydromethanopterin S-methyltransferase subunit H [Halobacteriales archaeon QS_1_68_17]|nr:MAG: tetrahydromethanopterin S-methyltransferase subunit H [Halobacteriales archaeon QS_1_68_17]